MVFDYNGAQLTINPLDIQYVVLYQEKDSLDVYDRDHLVIDLGDFHYDLYITNTNRHEIEAALSLLSAELGCEISLNESECVYS